MVPRPGVLWAVAAAALALLGRRAAAALALAGPVVRCEPCDARALQQCKPLQPDCAERVREPGCGCCLTCALRLGQPCGIYTERCGAGLSCQPQREEARPLQALLEGRGLCTNATGDGKLRAFVLPGPLAEGKRLLHSFFGKLQSNQARWGGRAARAGVAFEGGMLFLIYFTPEGKGGEPLVSLTIVIYLFFIFTPGAVK